MKVAGFTFVKNAVKYEYPVVESIKSILPLVDEFVVLLGDSDDNTEELIRSIGSEKIKFFHSVWDKDVREGGRVLAIETDKAMDKVSKDADWLFYLQADEVVHEQYLPVIREGMEKHRDNKRVGGLLFHYLHFYGSYRYIGDGRKWYSNEIRVIRNNIGIRSYKDAQGFRLNNRKLNVKQLDAYIYHYGWVRSPVAMEKKYRDFGELWSGPFAEAQGGNASLKEKVPSTTGGQAHARDDKEASTNQGKSAVSFDYSEIDSLTHFEGTHPEVMKERIEKAGWEFDHDIEEKNFKNLKHTFLYYLNQWFGWRPFEYRNYKRI